MFPLSKNSMVAIGRDYWKINLPARYQALRGVGKLDETLTAAAEMTLRAMQTLRTAGFSAWEAWETVRENHLLPAKEIASSDGRAAGFSKGSTCLEPQVEHRSRPLASRQNSRARWTTPGPRLNLLKMA